MGMTELEFRRIQLKNELDVLELQRILKRNELNLILKELRDAKDKLRTNVQNS
jgi:hypothetical protein